MKNSFRISILYFAATFFSIFSARAQSQAEVSSDSAVTQHTVASILPEAIIPAARTGNDESAALKLALDAFTKRTVSDDISALNSFIELHPDSQWSKTLKLNVALLYRTYGYQEKAMRLLGKIWQENESAKDAFSSAIANRAVGEYAELLARLGRVEDLEKLVEDTAKRDFSGPTTVQIGGAREGLWTMKNRPGIAFLCGPSAVNALWSLSNQGKAPPSVLMDYQSTPQGTSMEMLVKLSKKAGVPLRAVKVAQEAELPVPSVIHWRTNHFAAVLSKEGDTYLVQDPTFGAAVQLSANALREEGSGYFLVAARENRAGWQPMPSKETKEVWGMGYVSNSDRGGTGDGDEETGGCGSGGGMAFYSFHAMQASLHIEDTPVSYETHAGPDVAIRVVYNQREFSPTATPTWTNFGPKWNFSWISFIDVSSDPVTTGASVTVYTPGGGSEIHTGYTPASGLFGIQRFSRTILAKIGSGANAIYERRFSDGSKQVYAQPSSTTFPRKYFLTKLIDPAGATVTVQYDQNLRITQIADALGRVTTLGYDTTSTGNAYLVSTATDPFGRQAIFNYTGGRLVKITDPVGIASEFTYGANDFITSLKTPYNAPGKATIFTSDNSTSGTVRWVEATDENGDTERIEYRVDSTGSGIAYSEPVAPSIAHLPSSSRSAFNTYNYYRNSFYWDKKAWATYKTLSTRYIRATKLYHWLHTFDGSQTSRILESVKGPLTRRTYYSYNGQSNAFYEGPSSQPNFVTQLLDDGSTRYTAFTYNPLGKVASTQDAVGRITKFIYAANNLDLLEVRQVVGASEQILARYADYVGVGLPTKFYDKNGALTTYAYDSLGRPTQVSSPDGRTTTLTYSTTPGLHSLGYLEKISVTGASAPTQEHLFSWNNGQLKISVSPDTSTTLYDYDNLDRLTRKTYSNGTTEEITYDKLDPALIKDRTGNSVIYSYNFLRQLTKIIDPTGAETNLNYCSCGHLSGIVDASGNSTTFDLDEESRVTRKLYADGTAVTYKYEIGVGRLTEITDAKNQLKKFTYNKDDTVAKIEYLRTTGAVLASTPTVNFYWDNSFKRITSMVDGVGTTTYAYWPIDAAPVSGAGLLKEVKGPVLKNSSGSVIVGGNYTIGYGYDAAGRLASRTIDGAAETYSYDGLSRVSGISNLLGQFGLSWDAESNRLAEVSCVGGMTERYTYHTDDKDLLLASVARIASDGTPLTSKGMAFDYDPAGRITKFSPGVIDAQTDWLATFGYNNRSELTSAQYELKNQVSQISKNASFAFNYDPTGNRTNETYQDGGYSTEVPARTGLPVGDRTTTGTSNNLNQLTSTSLPRKFHYDNTGNRLADHNGASVGDYAGATDYREYGWDAENRLISWALYKGSSTASAGSTFVYDGLGRRVAEKKNGLVIKQWVWEGGAIVEERSGTGTITKRFFDQGFQRMLDGQKLYYVRDHLGSIWEVVDKKGLTSFARYHYDPYGRRYLLEGKDIADFGFTGHYQHQDTGLTLSLRRVYDSNTASWLSRDPLENITGELAELLPEGPSLYTYVGNDPANFVDPEGLGKVGFCIKGAKKIWKKVSKDRARKALSKGEDVLVEGPGKSKKAKQLAKEQFGDKTVRHDPHAPGQKPHYQHKNGGKGHVLYGVTLAPLTGVGQFGDNWFGNAVDFFNPLSDVNDIIDLINETDSDQEGPEESCDQCSQ